MAATLSRRRIAMAFSKHEVLPALHPENDTPEKGKFMGMMGIKCDLRR